MEGLNLQCDLADEGEGESPYEYLNGHLFPIDNLPYDISNDYRIIAKLGFGAFSTVWLAIGKGKDNRNDWFAIKIFKTDHNDNEEKAKTDMKMLEAKVPHMIPCLDTFKIKSRYKPNHSHLCLVMSASGPTLGSFVSANLLSFDERRLLAINVTKILNKMHKNDVILNDLSASNFLLRISDPKKYSESQLQEKLGKCESEPIYTQEESIKLPKHVPTWIYESKSLSPLVEETLDIQVIDIADHYDTRGERLDVRTNAFAAPELFIGESAPATRESNIWALGCLICQIMTLGNLPFEGGRFTVRSQDSYFCLDDEKKLEFLAAECKCRNKSSLFTLETEQIISLASFLKTIFIKDPKGRPSTDTILKFLDNLKIMGKQSPIPSSKADSRRDSAVSFRTIGANRSPQYTPPSTTVPSSNAITINRPSPALSTARSESTVRRGPAVTEPPKRSTTGPTAVKRRGR